jgi:HAD superfamily hydrolase (TIGR01509 family)
LASGNLATAHADFVKGWEPRRFEREIEACVHRDLVCNVPDDFSVVGAILSAVDLVIFDCDGVLVDSERLIVKVEAQICAERGWNITEDDIVREFVGLSDEAMRARLSELVGEVLDADWDAEYTDRYRAALASDLEVVPGVASAIDAIESAGVSTCVASSGSLEKMRLTLGKTGLWDRFDGRIFSSTDPAVERGKPAPDLFLHAAAQMRVDPGRCAVIEDSPYGIHAAVAAGMAPFGFAGSVIPAERLQAEGVTVFDHMDELPAALGLDDLPAG